MGVTPAGRLARAVVHDGHARAIRARQGEALLILSAGNQAAVEICFHHALDVAARQSAKSLEFRAAMSVSRARGKQDEGRRILAGVYGWFTEGFETADLQRARALLEESN